MHDHARCGNPDGAGYPSRAMSRLSICQGANGASSGSTPRLLHAGWEFEGLQQYSQRRRLCHVLLSVGWGHGLHDHLISRCFSPCHIFMTIPSSAQYSFSVSLPCSTRPHHEDFRCCSWLCRRRPGQCLQQQLWPSGHRHGQAIPRADRTPIRVLLVPHQHHNHHPAVSPGILSRGTRSSYA